MAKTNKKHFASFQELSSVIASLGQKTSQKDIDEMINQLDEDGSGTVDFPEFLNMMAKKLNEDDKVGELRQAFDIFDENNDGFIRSVFKLKI